MVGVDAGVVFDPLLVEVSDVYNLFPSEKDKYSYNQKYFKNLMPQLDNLLTKAINFLAGDFGTGVQGNLINERKHKVKSNVKLSL